MLNLFKLNTKKTNINKPVTIEKDHYYYKDFPISTREWNNSIYVFNKNTLALIPQATISTIKLIRGYFNAYNLDLEDKMQKARLSRWSRRLSSHKIYVSDGEFKHTNDKVIITLYTYNRQIYNYLDTLKKKYLTIFNNNNKREKLNNRFYSIKYKGFNYLKKANRDKYIFIKTLLMLSKVKNKEILNKYKNLYNDYLINFYKKLVKNSLFNMKVYLFYKQLLYINECKFNYSYLQILKHYMQIIYNKRVEFNLVNLKYNYLNSDILSESISLKITKNKRKLLRYISKLILKVKIYKTHKDVYSEAKLNKLNLKNINDPIESIFDNKNRPDEQKEKRKTVVLQDIEYKRLAGVRLEASGRLSKRYTASRSITILNYKGSLLNVNSSYRGLSTVILKGNLRSNLQYSKLKSKTRTGSFGIKIWVSGS